MSGLIGVVFLGLVMISMASEPLVAEEETVSSVNRAARQYHSKRPGSSPKPESLYEKDGIVHYDDGGLGFEITHPYKEIFQYQHRPGHKTEPSYKPAKPYQPERKPYYPSEPEPKPYYPEPKPVYPPSYKPEVPYPEEKPYGVKNPSYDYYCPKVYKLESQCRPAKDCAIWFDLVSVTPGTVCKLHDGSQGVCCPDLPYNGHGGAFKPPRKEVKLYRDIDIYSLNAAARAGQFTLRLMDETEKLMRANNITLRLASSSHTHLRFFQTKAEVLAISRGALTGVETTRELGKRFELNVDEAGFGLSVFSLRDTILKDTCPQDPVCDEDTIRSPFRTMDGSCNNLRRSSWGKSQTQFQRALTAAYADGVWQPRIAQNGNELPSPRLVSISVVPDIDAPHDTDTLWVMQYGQFVDHDITSTPVFRMNANSTGIQCCTEEGQMIDNAEFLHPECLSIEIPKDDPFFSKFGQRCMSFVRSTPAPRLDCNFGHGEQMNQNTHFLDHSNVYGSDLNDSRALRTFRGGALKVTPQKGHHELDLLPPDLDDKETDCTLSRKVTGVDPPREIQCFKAGDNRVNENPELAVTQTIFLRQHNRLVDELAYLNPHWDDERLYQEARRIMTAQMQHITYNEWLPTIIGREKMEQLGMLPLEYGFSQDYDENLNPTIVNEFATAAFRFGHSLIQGHMDLVNHRRKTETSLLLRQHFFKSQAVYTPGNLDKFLIGLATQPIQDFDNYFTEEVTNHLFEEEGKGFGMDLVSLNIQRGRDHGIQGYNAYRVLCGLPRAEHFRDLLDVISPAIVERFELLYKSVDDIDLFIGGVSERSVPGALVGPTFQCIVADQFLRLKRGDRFFYDIEGQPGSFTEEQLNEIRKTSLARLVCDTSNVYTAQPLAFKIESALNPVVDCNSAAIPTMSLLPWQEVYPSPEYAIRKPYPKRY